MSRNKFLTIGMGCLLIAMLLFYGYAQDVFILRHASSEAEVEQYLAHKTPGLTRAEQLGLVTPLNIEIQVTGAKNSVRLEKVWYNSKDVFLFYSIDKYKLQADSRTRQLYMALGPGFLTGIPEDVMFSGPGYGSGFSPDNRDGIIYRGRYYGRITYQPLYKQTPAQQLAAVEKAVWKKGALRIGEKSYPLPEVILPVNYERKREQVYSYKLNQTIDLLGRNFKAEELLLGIAENKLRFTFAPLEGEKVLQVRGEVVTDQGEKLAVHPLIEPGNIPGEYWLAFPALNRLPESITLALKQLISTGKDEVKFNLDVKSYKEYFKYLEGLKDNSNAHLTSELKKELGRVKQTRIILESMLFDKRGVNWELLFEPEQKSLPYEALIAGTPHENSEIFKNYQPGNVVDVTNEKGESGSLGQRGVGPGNRMGAFIDADFVLKSELLDVKITHLTSALYGDWALPIELQK